MRSVVIGSLVLLLTAPAAQAAPDPWQPVGADILSGVSGTAVVSRSGGQLETLIVRDNKKDGQNRIARVVTAPGKAPVVTPLSWTGELPVDLESIEPVPGKAGEYLVLASKGKGFQIKVSGGGATVLRTFQVPAGQAGDDYESFALAKVGGRTLALWADRGQDARLATLYAAEFDLGALTFGTKTSATVKVPYPKKNVRHMSDLDITPDGELISSAASDAGDDGPFDSAVYSLGRIEAGKNGPDLELRKDPKRLGTFTGRKVEAVTCLDSRCGEFLLGTDDENKGGALRTARRAG